MKLKKLNILYKETIGGYYEEPSVCEGIKETKEIKSVLDANRKEILEQLGNNIQIIEKINNLLKADAKIEALQSIEDLIKLQEFQNILYSSPDRLQHTIGLILDIRMRQYDNPQELIDDVSIVLNEKTLPTGTKILLLKSLKENNFNLKGTNSITALNYILANYPQYGKLFDDYMQETIDPQDGKLATTDMF